MRIRRRERLVDVEDGIVHVRVGGDAERHAARTDLGLRHVALDPVRMAGITQLGDAAVVEDVHRRVLKRGVLVGRIVAVDATVENLDVRRHV